MVQSSVGAILPLATSKKIDIILREVEAGLTIEGNSVLLSRAVSNLLDNAIKYTPSGGRVQVRTGSNNGHIYIAVIDNGPGIPAKDLHRVFEKFFRARPELDDIPGTGLGLAIVKIIVEQHGGKVWVESQQNEGSTFTIAIPAASLKS